MERHEMLERARSSLERAYFAYHSKHPAIDRDAHFFSGDSRYSACIFCGRTRELVRWDELPPQCLNRPTGFPYDAANVIFNEERSYLDLVRRAHSVVPKVVAKRGLDYDYLWDTHGIDRDLADDVVRGDAQ